MNGNSNGGPQEHARHHEDKKSLLQPTNKDELHDVVCVGFGPASLAIAIALHDALDSRDGASLLSTSRPKIAFLERQEQFAWHAGMQIPGAKMQISFIKDLATLRNPKSDFTFINYLHKQDRLIQFTNLDTFLPRRVEYEDYMRWCASWFPDIVNYSQDVLSIEPSKTSSGKSTSHFTVTSRNSKTLETTTLRSKNVIIAAGGRPRIPDSLPRNHPRVLHSSQYQTATSSLFADQSTPLRIAVVGGGQSAAEIFSDLPSKFPNSKSYLLLRSAAMKPSDDSPFVNEIFDPSRVDGIYAQTPDVRAEALAKDRSTNYGVVRPALLEHIYEEMYMQRLKHGNNEAAWPRQILPYRDVVGAEEVNGGVGSGSVKLQIKNRSTTYNLPDTMSENGHTENTNGDDVMEKLEVDLVLVASGYERNSHEFMLENCRHLLPSGDEKWQVDRDYRVRFAPDSVADDAGVWLQGCNESTHGLSDTLLSILAIRGGEMVQSIFGQKSKVKGGSKLNGVAVNRR